MHPYNSLSAAVSVYLGPDLYASKGTPKICPFWNPAQPDPDPPNEESRVILYVARDGRGLPKLRSDGKRLELFELSSLSHHRLSGRQRPVRDKPPNADATLASSDGDAVGAVSVRTQ